MNHGMRLHLQCIDTQQCSLQLAEGLQSTDLQSPVCEARKLRSTAVAASGSKVSSAGGTAALAVPGGTGACAGCWAVALRLALASSYATNHAKCASCASLCRLRVAASYCSAWRWACHGTPMCWSEAEAHDKSIMWDDGVIAFRTVSQD